MFKIFAFIPRLYKANILRNWDFSVQQKWLCINKRNTFDLQVQNNLILSSAQKIRFNILHFPTNFPEKWQLEQLFN